MGVHSFGLDHSIIGYSRGVNQQTTRYNSSSSFISARVPTRQSIEVHRRTPELVVLVWGCIPFPKPDILNISGRDHNIGARGFFKYFSRPTGW